MSLSKTNFLVLVQPRQTRPNITEKLLTSSKETNQTKSKVITYLHVGLFCMLFFCHLLIFFFQNQLFQKILSVSNSLNPDQARCFVLPDLCPNCLQTL